MHIQDDDTWESDERWMAELTDVGNSLGETVGDWTDSSQLQQLIIVLYNNTSNLI